MPDSNVKVVITGENNADPAFAKADSQLGRLNVNAREAKGAMALLGEETGVKIPRHLRSLLAEIGPVGKAFEMALYPAAAVATYEVLSKIIEKIPEITDALMGLSEADKQFYEGQGKAYETFAKQLEEILKKKREISLIGLSPAAAASLKQAWSTEDAEQLRGMIDRQRQALQDYNAETDRMKKSGFYGGELFFEKRSQATQEMSDTLAQTENRLALVGLSAQETWKQLSSTGNNAFNTAFDAIREKAHRAVLEGLDPLVKKAQELRDKIAEIRAFEQATPGRLFAGLNADASQLDAQLTDVEGKIKAVADALARGVVPGADGEQEKALQAITDGIAEGSKAWTEYDAELNKAAANFKANTASAYENYQQQIKLIETLQSLGKLSVDQASRAVAAADRQFADSSVVDKLGDVKAAGLDAAHAIGNAFENAVEQMKGGLSIIEGLLQDIERTILRVLVTKPLENALIGAIGNITGSLAGSLFRPHTTPYGGTVVWPNEWGHAEGGHMSAGEPGFIGEKGIEFWQPDVSGRVISNRELRGALGGGGKSNVQINVINKGQPADVTSQFSREELGRLIVDVTLDNIERGGPMRGAIQGAARSA